MSDRIDKITEGMPTKNSLKANFANSRLATIATAAQIRSAKSIWTGIVLEILSWLFAFTGFLLIVNLPTATDPFPSNHPMFNILNILYGVLVFSIYLLAFRLIIYIVFRVRRLGKRYRLNALSDLSKDPRDPILYLRSFQLESAEDPNRSNRRTPEEDLALSLKAVGPVVTIGAPDEEKPLLGANRIYLKNDDWQDKVERLMSISQLVVIQAGISKGLAWEIEAAIRKVEPTKLLISFLIWQDLDAGVRYDRYRRFKHYLRHALSIHNLEKSIQLPDSIGDAIFLVFRFDWAPELIKIGKWKKFLYRFSISTSINETLRPILRVRGLQLKRWKTNIYLIFIVWLVITLFDTALYPISLARTSNGDTYFYFILNKCLRPLTEAPLLIVGWIISIPLFLYIITRDFAQWAVLSWLMPNVFVSIFNRIIGKNSKKQLTIKVSE